MFCSSCGSEIKEGQAFCSNCGAPAPAQQPVQQAQPAVQQPVVQQVVEQPVQQPVQPNPPKPAPSKGKGNGLCFISLGLMVGAMIICSGIVALFGYAEMDEIFAVYSLGFMISFVPSMALAIFTKIKYKTNFALVLIIIYAVLAAIWIVSLIIFMIVEAGSCLTDCVHHF